MSMSRQAHLFSYSTSETVKSARRKRIGLDLLRLGKLMLRYGPYSVKFSTWDISSDISRVCIKLSGTWEGLQEATGMITTATIVSTLAPVTLAGDIGSHYVTPYLDNLKAQFDER